MSLPRFGIGSECEYGHLSGPRTGDTGEAEWLPASACGSEITVKSGSSPCRMLLWNPVSQLPDIWPCPCDQVYPRIAGLVGPSREVRSGAGPCVRRPIGNVTRVRTSDRPGTPGPPHD